MHAHRPRAPIVILLGALVLLLVSAVAFGLPQVRRAAELGRVARARSQLAAFAAACEAYRVAFGNLPAGPPASVVGSLTGSNARRQVFLDLKPGMTDGAGALIDPWGTPWEFTYAGSRKLEARVAGPNRRFGDDDDLSSTAAWVAAPAPLRPP
jgi:hypothetical protein